jgi:hypothetical protein
MKQVYQQLAIYASIGGHLCLLVVRLVFSVDR